MKKEIVFFFASLLLFCSPEFYAQDTLGSKYSLPAGISLEYGFGNFAVTDEYISKEKYSGTLPYYSVRWIKLHEDYIYRLGAELRYSNEIKNYNVRADIYQFTLNQGFLYSIPEIMLFERNVYIYLGPSTELFFFYNKQNIAVSGFDYSQSFAALFSLGFHSEVFYPLWNNLNIESALGFSLLSLGFRMVDSEETDVSPVKPLTLFSGLHGIFKLGVRYYLFNNLSVKGAYLFNITRISSWDPLLSASDNLVLTLTYGF